MKKYFIVLPVGIVALLIALGNGCGSSGSGGGDSASTPTVGPNSLLSTGTYKLISLECEGVVFTITSGDFLFFLNTGSASSEIRDDDCSFQERNMGLTETADEITLTGGEVQCVPNPCSLSITMNGAGEDVVVDLGTCTFTGDNNTNLGEVTFAIVDGQLIESVGDDDFLCLFKYERVSSTASLKPSGVEFTKSAGGISNLPDWQGEIFDQVHDHILTKGLPK